MATGKRLTVLEMPEDDDEITPETLSKATLERTPAPAPPAVKKPTEPTRPASIPLPPIPAAPRREIMIQLSIKAPLALVERLESLTKATGAQKQAVLAASARGVSSRPWLLIAWHQRRSLESTRCPSSKYR